MSFLIDVSWYSLVALVLFRRPRGVYLRLKRKIDIATATVLGALGLRLIATSLSPANRLHGMDTNIVLLKGNAIFATDILLHHQHIISLLATTTNRATAGILSEVRPTIISLHCLITAF
jgi:hypothetical protein